MKILQIVKTYNQNCGIAFFAKNLQEQMKKIGIKIETISTEVTCIPSSFDTILLHYHSELLNYNEVSKIRGMNQCPLILFTHSNVIQKLIELVDGSIAMCSGMIPHNDKPKYIFPHPAWVPKHLEDRLVLRNKYKLPTNATIIGTNGFLKFERQFVEILSRLLPHAKDNNWFIYLITSPWYIESPGLKSELERFSTKYSAFFKFEYNFLEKNVLNQKLQACDILWCWTKAPSSSYASGVISDQYASGTHIFATNKLQHKHVIELPNVTIGSDELDLFVEQLIYVIKHGKNQRHDPSIISWKHHIKKLALFFSQFIINN